MKKRNPQDITLRNLRAHGKRIAALERETKSLRTELNRLRFGRKGFANVGREVVRRSGGGIRRSSVR